MKNHAKPSAKRKTWFASCYLLAACGLLSAGCVRRSLTIRSNPAGAKLWLNDRPIGTTPTTFDFEWYGQHRVTLSKPGYQMLDTKEWIKAPVHLWIPFDLVMELLPVTIRDVRELSYTLKEKSPILGPVPPSVSHDKEPSGDAADDAKPAAP